MLHYLILNKDLINQFDLTEEQFFDNIALYIPNSQNCLSGIWKSKNNELYVFYWVRESKNLKVDYYVDHKEGSIRLFCGWARNTENLSTSLSEREPLAEEHSGEYMTLSINDRGIGELKRSRTASLQTYYGSSGNNQAVSSRSSLISMLINNKSKFINTLNIRHLEWMITTSWSQENSTLFNGVSILKQNEHLTFANNKLEIVTNPFFSWREDKVKKLYSENRKEYWDKCHTRLIDNLNFFFDEYDRPFRFPLSGGKDSRLLLGLILSSRGKSLLEGTYTNGTPYSGEVISAKMVANKLGLKHEINTGSYHGFEMRDKLANHIFFTEAEVSPMDLCWNFEKLNKGMILRGQEVSLRNISNIIDDDSEKVRSWFSTHFNGFDILKILREESSEKLSDCFFNEYNPDKFEPNLVSDLPNINRIQTRFLRWGGRIWSVHNTNEFSPFVFLDYHVMKYTLNAGAKSRMSEEFHIEMMKRSERELIDIPFFNQSWPNLVQKQPHLIQHFAIDNKPIRGSHAVLMNNFNGIKKYVLDSRAHELLKDVVDWNKFDAFNKEDFKSGHFQPFWNLFQISVISNSDSILPRDIQKTIEKNDFPSLSDESTDNKSANDYQEKLGVLLLKALVEKEGDEISERSYSEVKTKNILLDGEVRQLVDKQERLKSKVERLKAKKDEYKNKYGHLPSWYVAIGSIFKKRWKAKV